MIQQLSPTRHRFSDKYVLLTGATGFLGRYLLRDLLLSGHRVAVVARPRRRDNAQDRIEAVMQRWEDECGRLLPRPVVLAGDVRERQLGLSRGDLAWVRSCCNRILHAAANLQFFGDRNCEPWTTNVGGTQNVVGLCDRFPIEQFHYLSTAYVCGQRQGRILENELHQGQSFRNDYEHSKFVAEQWVREHCSADSVTVYRPAVIVGDSRTGATTSYHGLFLYLRLLAMLVPQQKMDARGVHYTPIQLPLQGDEPRNLVPVDWVSKVVCELFSNRAAHGRTFHLAPDVRTTPRLIVDSCYEYFHSSGVEYVGPESKADGHESEFAKSYFANTKIYHDYDRSDPEFDRQDLLTFAEHLPCPAIETEMIHRFLDFGERDQWGKSRPRPLRATIDVEAGLRLLTQREPSDIATSQGALAVAIEIFGPGGGQWTLSRDRAGPWRMHRGILPTVEHLLQLNSADVCPNQTCGVSTHWFGKLVETAHFALATAGNGTVPTVLDNSPQH